MIGRLFRPNIDRLRPIHPRHANKAGRRFDHAGSSYRQQHGADPQLLKDALHGIGDFAEPADVRPQQRLAFRTGRNLGVRHVTTLVVEWLGTAARREQRVCISRPCMCTMRCDPACSCKESTFWVHRKKRSPQCLLQVGQSKMRRIGGDGCMPLAALGIELPHHLGIGAKGLGRSYILHVLAAPQSVGAAKRRQARSPR